MMWQHAQNGSDERPREVDDLTSRKYVYVRRNLVLVESTEDAPAHWEWDELKVAREAWEAWEQGEANADGIADLSTTVSDTADAEQVNADAIAELSELVSSIIGGE